MAPAGILPIVDIKQKIAYLQGLANGLGVEEKGPQGAVLTGILDVLEDIADALEGAGVSRVSAQWEVTCPACGAAFTVRDEDLDDDEIELICPHCGEVIHDFDDDLEADEPDEEMTDSR